MNFLELATTHYTTKSYQDKRIEKKTIEALKEILRLSPSSINSQPWQFLFVSDEKLKNESLAKLSLMNEQRVKQASHLVIFRVMSPALFEEKRSQYISPSGYAFYQQHMKPQGEAYVASWLAHQVYVALGYFLTACTSMGIDSTPMEGILKEAYDKHLPKEEGYHTLFAVAIGYRDPEDKNQPTLNPKNRLPLTEVIREL